MTDKDIELDTLECQVADAMDEGATPDEVRLAVERAIYDFERAQPKERRP